jgi:hypothetical protein
VPAANVRAKTERYKSLATAANVWARCPDARRAVRRQKPLIMRS